MNKLWAALKRCTIVSKKEVLYAGPFGLGLWLGGVIFIDRLNSEKSREAINKVSTKLKRDDVSGARRAPQSLLTSSSTKYRRAN